MSKFRKTAVLLSAVAMLGFVGCTAMTGKSAGRNVDDASITTAVKAKLATDEGLSTVTRIDVDTNNGVVILNGTVNSSTERARAAELARHVDGVGKVINNLTVRGHS